MPTCLALRRESYANVIGGPFSPRPQSGKPALRPRLDPTNGTKTRRDANNAVAWHAACTIWAFTVHRLERTTAIQLYSDSALLVAAVLDTSEPDDCFLTFLNRVDIPMQMTNCIQTIHGVSYPLVGVGRVEQSELAEDEVPPAAGERSSQADAGPVDTAAGPQHRPSQFHYARRSQAALPFPEDRYPQKDRYS